MEGSSGTRRASSSCRSRALAARVAARSTRRAPRRPTEPPQQVAPDTRQQVIAGKRRLVAQVVHEREPDLGAERHRHRHRMVEGHDWRRRDAPAARRAARCAPSRSPPLTRRGRGRRRWPPGARRVRRRRGFQRGRAPPAPGESAADPTARGSGRAAESGRPRRSSGPSTATPGSPSAPPGRAPPPPPASTSPARVPGEAPRRRAPAASSRRPTSPRSPR